MRIPALTSFVVVAQATRPYPLLRSPLYQSVDDVNVAQTKSVLAAGHVDFSLLDGAYHSILDIAEGIRQDLSTHGKPTADIEEIIHLLTQAGAVPGKDVTAHAQPLVAAAGAGDLPTEIGRAHV